MLTPRTLFLEARTILAEHAKIMVRILKKIFGLHTVARKLRIARHAFVFFEQLGGVAALAIVLTVPRLSAGVWAPLSTAAAPAAALSIIDQMLRPYAVSLAPSPQADRAAPMGRSSDPLVPVLAPSAK
jgi:hypothetical protein